MPTKYKKSFYLIPSKIIRDLVHEYVNVTSFELEIIATVPFQRLKDIRQLTCQQVYPSACHTRFEHSLGVLELTRQAIKHLNRNGIMGEKKHYCSDKIPVLNDSLQFNATLAALLHDVGHCPFSHLGEKEFDYTDVKTRLVQELEDCTKTTHCGRLINQIRHGAKGTVGAIHEMLSCIIILTEYEKILSDLNVSASDENDACIIKTDFELIIRSILGIVYDESDPETYKSNIEKNAVIRLINSNIIDMDKLDYIMRDSTFTGISIPKIDTQRLFRNMYLDRNYQIIFTSKAVPVLQSIIEARDVLYMYVYNHHVAVFSDFMNSYILSRLTQNTHILLELVYPDSHDSLEMDCDLPILKLGLVPKSYLFSVDSILSANRSDSDWISLLNIIYYDRGLYTNPKLIIPLLRGEISSLVSSVQISPSSWNHKPEELQNVELEYLSRKIQFVMKLIHQYKTREYLGAWWKTVYEFKNFMNLHFMDEIERKRLCRWICRGGEYGLSASEFRSQIAKHVIFIAAETNRHLPMSFVDTLQEGDFFIIERSNRFFEIDTIEQLSIAIKIDGTAGTAIDTNSTERGYYRNSLVNIIPQKDYSAIYDKDGFYIFTKRYGINDASPEYRHRIQSHQKLLEKIFVFVASEFLKNTEQNFIVQFQSGNKKTIIENELSSKTTMFNKFLIQLQQNAKEEI